MKIKTSELTGLALDWAITLIEDSDALKYGTKDWREQRTTKVVNGEYVHRYHQSWAQGGPIIERERISIAPYVTLAHPWDARIYAPDEEPWQAAGPTPLIAAMRCYVASKLGDEVEVPDELAG